MEELEGVGPSFTAACAVRGPTPSAKSWLSSSARAGAIVEVPVELIRKVRERISRAVGVTPAYLVPLAVEDIPKTAIGKIQRGEAGPSPGSRRLRRFAQAHRSGAGQPSHTPELVLPKGLAAARRAPGRPAAPGRFLVFVAPSEAGKELERRPPPG